MTFTNLQSMPRMPSQMPEAMSRRTVGEAFAVEDRCPACRLTGVETIGIAYRGPIVSSNWMVLPDAELRPCCCRVAASSMKAGGYGSPSPNSTRTCSRRLR